MFRYILAVFIVLNVYVNSSTTHTDQGSHTKKEKLNLLLIMYDDLRPDLNLYGGRSYMNTPNFDRLARKSLMFDHAFCQVAVCNPSRGSLLTGKINPFF